MMVIDLDYHVIDVNRALLEMVGLRKKMWWANTVMKCRTT